MKAHLLTGWINQFQHGHFNDSCSSFILVGLEHEDARRQYEQGLLSQSGGEASAPVKVEAIVSGPVSDHLLTEAGPVPIEWDQVAEQAAQDLDGTAMDDSEQGYWVDANQLVDPEQLPFSVEGLQAALPEDIQAGLNWKPERNFFYLVNVLAPPKPILHLPEEADDFDPSDPAYGEANVEIAKARNLARGQTLFQELAARELTALVRARNSIVAAWLWRTHAKETPLARNAIQICAWTGAAIFGAEKPCE